MESESESNPDLDAAEEVPPDPAQADGEAPPALDAAALLAATEERAASLKDQLLRTAADFDNFRKRARREVDDARQAGRDGMLKDLLPVFDNLERAAQHVTSATDVESVASGIELVMKQFRDTLGKHGIERIQSVGQPFDPSVHEAIQQLATSDFEPGSVAGEVQGGYRMGERLIRPAMVVVAKAPAPPEGSPSAPPANEEVN